MRWIRSAGRAASSSGSSARSPARHAAAWTGGRRGRRAGDEAGRRPADGPAPAGDPGALAAPDQRAGAAGRFLRGDLARRSAPGGGAVPARRWIGWARYRTRALADLPPGPVRLGGLVVTRQHPMTARGTVFLALEDETGMVNVTLWPDTWAAPAGRGPAARAAARRRDLQREGNVVNVIAREVSRWSRWRVRSAARRRRPASGSWACGDAADGLGAARYSRMRAQWTAQRSIRADCTAVPGTRGRSNQPVRCSRIDRPRPSARRCRHARRFDRPAVHRAACPPFRPPNGPSDGLGRLAAREFGLALPRPLAPASPACGRGSGSRGRGTACTRRAAAKNTAPSGATIQAFADERLRIVGADEQAPGRAEQDARCSNRPRRSRRSGRRASSRAGP